MANKPLFTNIQHIPRLKLGISCNEYCVADIIHWGAYNPKNPTGWCYASKNYIGDALGISKKSTLEIIERLIKKGLVEKDATNKHLRTTTAWYDALSLWAEPGNEKLPTSVTKVNLSGNETCPQIGNETLPNNNNLIIKKQGREAQPLKERKTKFFKSIQDWKFKNPSKYPTPLFEAFFKYWTETNELDGATKMRFETNEFFELGRRLATFWKNTKGEERAEWYRQDELEQPINTKQAQELFSEELLNQVKGM